MKAEDPQARPQQLKRSGPKDYLLRFIFGGIVTAAVGIIGKAFGPTVAGLFLAFPAILPASMTLVEKHENSKAAGRDAMGAAAGSIGLIAFGAVIWLVASRTGAWLALLGAMAAWLVVSIALWWGAMEARDWEKAG